LHGANVIAVIINYGEQFADMFNGLTFCFVVTCKQTGSCALLTMKNEIDQFLS
jgi:hypothetical protein